MPINAQVGILMGSKSDHETMKIARDLLEEFGVRTHYEVMSAHRTPQVVAEFADEAKANGIKVIIAGAGGAAHLAGVVAAHTTLPVIGVPLEGSSLNGLDALLATVQMPGGVPVATVSIGKWGAKNAAILALQILALSDPKLSEKLEIYKKDMAEKSREQP